jgi:hypothetical protein
MATNDCPFPEHPAAERVMAISPERSPHAEICSSRKRQERHPQPLGKLLAVVRVTACEGPCRLLSTGSTSFSSSWSLQSCGFFAQGRQ